MNLRVRCARMVLLRLCCFAATGLIVALTTAAASAQTASRSTIQAELGFEQQTDTTLKGWWSNPPGTVTADDTVAHTGKWSARIMRDDKSASTFSAMGRMLPVDFIGRQIELRGWLRVKDVSGYAGLWLRLDGDGKTLAIDNMEAQKVKGTRDWAEYRIGLQLNPGAQQIVFGALMEGTGTTWADDLELLVDGKPIAEAIRETPLPDDHEFDGGSKIAIPELSPMQVENLATLARVWGFLKYHHPAVTAGQKHWDYELFRVMPAVLAAKDHAGADAAMTAWIDRLGPVEDCNVGKACVSEARGDLQLKPQLDWIRDRATLGAELSARLQRAYENRTGKQFFVSLNTAAGNPRFAHEPSYAAVKLPDAGYQLLALFRWWNMVQYWSPGREVAGQFWPSILREFIPKIALAGDKDAYQLVLFELIGKLNDTHANLWSSLDVRPPTGSCWLPAQVRWVEGKPVVWHVNAEAGNGVLQPGDAIEKMDGAAVGDLIAQWMPYYADSNDAARMRDITAFMTRGACGPVALDLTRAGKPVRVTVARVEHVRDNIAWHDRAGDTFVMLAPDVAYLKLSGVKTADVPGYFEKAKAAKGIIIDIRNYPSEYASYALASMLAEKPTKFIVFSHPDIFNPGAFRYDTEPVITPAAQHYAGKVVVLVDEVTQSQAEFTTMALRAMPNTTVVGSTTAGADGDVSEIPLPGGLRTMLSGLGVFYPNHAPTQRVGIVPDVVVSPTIKGVAAGRDEVLEKAIEEIRRNAN